MNVDTCRHIGALISYTEAKCAIAKALPTTDDNGEAMVSVPLAWFEMMDRKCATIMEGVIS